MAAVEVEVKYKVHPSDIAKATKNLKRYREFCAERKNYRLYGSIAGFSVPAGAVKAAKEQELFVLKRAGQVVYTDTKEIWAFGCATPDRYLIRSCLRNFNCASAIFLNKFCCFEQPAQKGSRGVQK